MDMENVVSCQNHFSESESTIKDDDSELFLSFTIGGCVCVGCGCLFSRMYAYSCHSWWIGSFSMSNVKSGESLFSDTIFHTPAKSSLGRAFMSSQSFLFYTMVIGLILSLLVFPTLGALGFLGTFGLGYL